MIDFKEHLYDDDPSQGHPDVRTRLRDAYYFLLGNGRIQAAVQISPAGEGTPLGLLVMDPERLGKKREALTFEDGSGLEGTMLGLHTGGQTWHPDGRLLQAHWITREGVPAVEVSWPAGDAQVTECFFCPWPDRPMLVREVKVRSPQGMPHAVLTTALRGQHLRKELALFDNTASWNLCYRLEDGRVLLEEGVTDELTRPHAERLTTPSSLSFAEPLLDHYFNAARVQLPAAISASGRMDGSIWQYNREWVRDQSMVVLGLLMAGHHQLARTMLARLFAEFVTPEGDTVDSSVRRDPDEVELDQGGALLSALAAYCRWTGELSFADQLWQRVVAVAEFPLQPVFRHPGSGLLANSREYWERHRLYGILPGMELTYQLYAAVGLHAAAEMARALGHANEAERWTREATSLWGAALHHPTHSLVEGGRLIKRRGLDGQVQRTITASAEAQLHPSVPLAGPGPHYLNPDTSCVLPIALEMLHPTLPIAQATLADMEQLWNQQWDIGGYGRYHVSSEPDSPGPWPFASLFVARALAEAGDGEKVWRVLRWLNSVPGGVSGAWFEFYGPRPCPPCPQVGIIPWTWAEMLGLLVEHVAGVRPRGDGLHIRPQLLPGVNRIQGDFPFRGGRLCIDIKRAESPEQCRLHTDGQMLRSTAKEAVISYQEGDLHVEAVVA